MTSTYNPSAVVDLLSRDRLARYKRPSGGWPQVSDAEALKAYRLALESDARYLVFMGGVEVILRNAMDEQLCTHFGDWTKNLTFKALLDNEDVARLERAWDQCEEERNRRTTNLKRHNPKATPPVIERGHVVAALSFGFWRRMFIRSYDLTLWVPVLHKAFIPEARSAKKSLLEAASRFNYERNRLAHHERLTAPKELKQDGLLLGGAVSPDALGWLDSLI